MIRGGEGMSNLVNGQKQLTKILLNIFSIVAILIFYAVNIIIICDGYKAGRLSYLYPRLTNLNECIVSIIVGTVITLFIILLLLFRTKTIKTRIAKVIVLCLCCILLLFNSIWLSVLFNFDSHTENIDDYMLLDSVDYPICETKSFFPEKERIIELEKNEVDVEYNYKFQYPLLFECMIYDIELIADFQNNKNAFDDLLEEELSKSFFSTTVENDKEIVIVYLDENKKINGEDVVITHKIVVDKQNNTFHYLANLSLNGQGTVVCLDERD